MLQALQTAPKSKLRGIAILRLDFNTDDDWRMRACLPTIKFLMRYAEKVIIVSHKGRPHTHLVRGLQGEREKRLYSLRPDARKLGAFLGCSVRFIPDFNFEKIKETLERAPRGSVTLLENIRFVSGEAENRRGTAEKIAALGNYYVDDAFAVSHRTNASLVAITKLLPSFAGINLVREVAALSRVTEHPRKPLVVILGGGKVKDKLGVVKRFAKEADYFLVGGAAANTLLFLAGVRVGESLREKDPTTLRLLRPLLNMERLLLPEDWRVSKKAILDIGPKTERRFAAVIANARTVVWSGPMGKFENAEFARGSAAIARAIRKNKKAFSVVGGGETVTFLTRHKLDRGFSFLSTGGGAMLDFLAGEKLPGIEALKRK